MKAPKDETTEAPEPQPGRRPGSPEEIAAAKATLADLVAKANAGDQEALSRLRAFMDEHSYIHEMVGDLTRRAEATWLAMVVGDDVLSRESVQRELARLKGDLAGEHPAAVEKLLVDEVGLCYLAQRQAQIMASAAGGSLAQAAFRLRRAESAQRRFLNAVKTLAQLRALVPEGLVPLNPLRLYTEKPERRHRA